MAYESLYLSFKMHDGSRILKKLFGEHDILIYNYWNYYNSFDDDLNSGGLVDWVKCQHMLLFMAA